jgi:hypothetical protein
LALQKLCQPHDRIVLFLPLFSFVFVSVQGWVIRSGVISHSVCHKFNKVRFLFFQDELAGFSGGLPTGEGIISIDSGTGDTHWYGSGNDTIRGVLIFSGSGNSVLVVSADEKSLALESGSEVESNGKISLTSSTLADITSGDLLLIIDSESISRPCSLRDLSC